MKLVSIIMATYNRAHFIEETLQSIQNQTYKNFECLIIDDGSTDNTSDIVAPFVQNDPRFQYRKRSNNYLKGLPGSRNYGLDLAQGEYIIFFDDDDIVHPQNLEISCKELIQQNIDFCHFQKKSFYDAPEIALFQDYEAKIITVHDIKNILNHKIGLASCTVLWTKRCFQNTRFNECLLYAEEWECYLKIISSGFTGTNITAVLYYNRKHSQSNTGEFYLNNPVRRKSNADAIFLVAQNLRSKNLLTYSLQKQLVTLSYQFKDFNLFDNLMTGIDLHIGEIIYWRTFYFFQPVRLVLYKLKKGKYFKVK